MVAFRRPRSLKDLLVRARDPLPADHNPNKEPIGFHPCKSKKCMLHKYITETDKFISTQTKQEFPITTHINCKSSWLIYLITCSLCGKQYIGKTETTLYTRFSNTKSEIINFNNDHAKRLPYTLHFNSEHHTIDHVRISGIEKISKHSRNTILHKGSFWINKLKTLQPHEINIEQ